MGAAQVTSGMLNAAGLLAGRLLLALIFVREGWTIMGNCNGAAAYMQKLGVPAILRPAVIALKLGGGLLIVAGVLTRLVASLFAIFCVLTAVLFHWQLADAPQAIVLSQALISRHRGAKRAYHWHIRHPETQSSVHQSGAVAARIGGEALFEECTEAALVGRVSRS